MLMPDNANPTWWRDAGLRKMALHVGMLYCAVFTFGVSYQRQARLKAV